MSDKKDKDITDFITALAKGESHQKIPHTCPLINECRQQLLETEYRTLCCTESWVFCKHSNSKNKQYRRSPYFWKFAEKIEGELGGSKYDI